MGAVAPLGVLYIASVLREAGHQVRLFDAGELWDPEPFREALRAFRPAVIGLSAITIEARGRMNESSAMGKKAVGSVRARAAGKYSPRRPRNSLIAPPPKEIRLSSWTLY